MALLKQNPFQEWSIYLIGGEPFRYHCWHRRLEQWYLQGRVYRTYGTINLTAGIVFLILSSLVLWAFRSHSLMKSSCFKILYVLGIVAWFEIFTISLWPAFLLHYGGVFCTNPIMGMIAGRSLTMEWVAGSTICLFLSLNRLADMTRKKWLKKFFDTPNKVNGMFFFTFCYSLMFALFTDPCVYNSASRSFSLNPFNGMDEDLFENEFVLSHNVVFVFVLIVINSIMIFKLATEYENCWRGTSDLQRKILIQSTILCLQYLVPCVVFFLISVWNSYDVPKCFLEGTHVWFQFTSGLTGCLFLLLNRPVRVKFLEKIGLKQYVIQPQRRNGAPSITRSIM